jgi:hypothetical protein
LCLVVKVVRRSFVVFWFFIVTVVARVIGICALLIRVVRVGFFFFLSFLTHCCNLYELVCGLMTCVQTNSLEIDRVRIIFAQASARPWSQFCDQATVILWPSYRLAPAKRCWRQSRITLCLHQKMTKMLHALHSAHQRDPPICSDKPTSIV